MSTTEMLYRDTVRLADLYRSQGRDDEAAAYDKQAEMWKKKLEEIKP